MCVCVCARARVGARAYANSCRVLAEGLEAFKQRTIAAGDSSCHLALCLWKERLDQVAKKFPAFHAM